MFGDIFGLLALFGAEVSSEYFLVSGVVGGRI